MNRAAIVLHADRPASTACGEWLGRMLRARGVEVFASADDALRIGGAETDDLQEPFDLMFALGGDGTFLRAAQAAARTGTPLLGVNLGRVGFLASIERADLERALESILRDGVITTERMTLEGEVEHDGEVQSRFWALNDVSVTKLEPARLIKLGISIGGEPLTHIAADGVVVCTPTGSTAYSFSAGGPVVSPSVDCIVVTPVSPHLAFDRSFVAAPEDEIELRVLPDPDSVAVSPDGREWVRAETGSKVRIRRSPLRLRMAEVESVPFWRLVRKKFRLPELH